MLKRILIALILLSPLYLMSVNAIAQENSSSGLFSKLQQLGIKLGQSNPQELLPPDEAFKISVEVRDGQTLVANLTPAKDYYLYRDKIIFESKETDTAIEKFPCRLARRRKIKLLARQKSITNRFKPSSR